MLKVDRLKDSSGDEAEQNQSLPPLLASLARGDANAAKMVLAYEISVNEDFQMVNVRENNKSVEGQVASTMERAFWDILRKVVSLIIILFLNQGTQSTMKK